MFCLAWAILQLLGSSVTLLVVHHVGLPPVLGTWLPYIFHGFSPLGDTVSGSFLSDGDKRSIFWVFLFSKCPLLTWANGVMGHKMLGWSNFLWMFPELH